MLRIQTAYFRGRISKGEHQTHLYKYQSFVSLLSTAELKTLYRLVTIFGFDECL